MQVGASTKEFERKFTDMQVGPNKELKENSTDNASWGPCNKEISKGNLQ